MATARGRTKVPYLLLLLLGTLLFTAAVAASWDEDEREPSSQRRCARRCSGRPSQERSRCVQECRQRREQGGREREHESGQGSDEDEREQEEFSRQRPYVFNRRSFRRAARSEHGSIRSLRPFHEASELLAGIRNYRVVVLEANPRSFVVPAHADADAIGYVVQGEGVVSTIENGERRSYAIREGHVFVAPAGAITYFANTDSRRKLVIAKILHTISVPGKYELFFGPGGKNPESIVSSFSESIQRAAFKTSTERIQKVFGKQDQGIIVRASEQQVRELQRQASEGGRGQRWPLPPFGESHGPFDLREQRPKAANRHGQLYEADASSFQDLAEHDIRVSLVNISAGSMSAPFYNTRSIKIAYVLEGEGRAEIVCPHLSRSGESEGKRRREREESESEEGEEEQQQQEEAGQGYQTIRARLSKGTVFVVPVGHPVVEVASGDSNLQIICFEVQARQNEKVALAGQNSAFRKLDRVAKELAFAASAREVDEVLNAQSDKWFLQGPRESGRQEEEREGRHGRRREEVAETLLRMATGGL